jgi:hypothetical protein
LGEVNATLLTPQRAVFVEFEAKGAVMAIKSKEIKSHRQRLRGLYGGLSASPAVARRAKAAKQKELSRNFTRQEASRSRHARIMERVHAPVLKAYAKDAKFLRAVAPLKSLVRQMRRRRLARPVVPLQEPRIVADLGATVVPPYDFQEMLFSSAGMALNASSANKMTGLITSSIGGNRNNPSSATVIVGVGIFFHPPTTCPGTLSISASPGLTFDWDTISILNSAHSDGWVGIAVEQFDMAGIPTGVLVDQRISLWSSNTWWQGDGFNDGSNNAFPLFAQCTVDSQHFYHVWVRCGGSISAAGMNQWFGSDAGSRIFGSVPSITWELM